MNLDDDVDLGAFATETDGLSGAELASLATEAGMFAIRDGRPTVERADFHAAQRISKPSTTPQRSGRVRLTLEDSRY